MNCIIAKAFTTTYACIAVGYIIYVLYASKISGMFRGLVGRYAAKSVILRRDQGEIPPSLLRRMLPILDYPLRYVDEMLMCPYCTGFWVSVAWQTTFRVNLFGHGWIGIIASSAVLACVGGRIAQHLKVWTTDIVAAQNRRGTANED